MNSGRTVLACTLQRHVPPAKAKCPANPMQTSRGVSDAQQVQEMLAEGNEAAEFIRSSIVQATMNERGAYGAP